MTLQKCTEDQKILKFHPHHHIPVMHELKVPDKEQWIHYCRWLAHFIQGDIAILNKAIFTNKAWV
jgi:hypothetical protein